MFNRLSHILHNKFSGKSDLSRQVEIARVLDFVRQALKKQFPNEEIGVVSLKNGTLTIQLSNSVLANELRLRQTIIMAEINSATGKEVLKKIIYRF